MSIDSSTIRRLAALNLPPEAMSEVLSIIADMSAADEARKAKDRARKKAISTETPRKLHGISSEIPVEIPEQGSLPPPPKESPPIPPKEIPPLPTLQSRCDARDAIDADFESRFWPEWPHKVGKPKALAAFRTARRKHSLETIMAGISRYIAGKPSDRPWLNPATFLNQERFNDAPAGLVDRGPPPPSAKPRTAAAIAAENILARHAKPLHDPFKFEFPGPVAGQGSDGP